MLPTPRDRELLELYLPYRGLVRAAGSLHGQLLLLSDPRRTGAARLLGGAVLLALPTESEAKAAMQAGLCDFVVTSLDEALRILKNEVRRQAPVGVCLRAALPELQQWCVERGVQPEFVDAAEPTLEARGARQVRWPAALEAGEALVRWELPTGAGRTLEALDRLVLRMLPEADRERRRWVEHAPATFGRIFRRTRALPLKLDETAELLRMVETDEAVRGCVVERDRERIWPVS